MGNLDKIRSIGDGSGKELYVAGFCLARYHDECDTRSKTWSVLEVFYNKNDFHRFLKGCIKYYDWKYQICSVRDWFIRVAKKRNSEVQNALFQRLDVLTLFIFVHSEAKSLDEVPQKIYKKLSMY